MSELISVRRARPTDLPTLLALGRAMHAESPRYRHLAFDEGKTARLIGFLIDRPAAGVLFVAESVGQIVGLFGGAIGEHMYTHGRFANDLAIYVCPSHRGGVTMGRLLQAFEAWAVDAGADEILLGVSTEVHAEQTAGMFERKGYARSCISLRKTITRGEAHV